MDYLKLIECVAGKSELWDKHNRFYYNREIKKKSWQEVAQHMKSSEHICRQKWTNLRDVFRKELKKIASTENAKSKWNYFQHLYFLKDHVTLQEKENHDEKYNSDGELDLPQYAITLKEACSPDNTAHSITNDGSSLEDTAKNTDTINTIHETKVESSQTISTQDNKDVPISDMEQIPEHTLPQRNCASELQDADGDYYFLMSLLPYMKNISPEKKMLLRMRMMQVLYEEIFQAPEAFGVVS